MSKADIAASLRPVWTPSSESTCLKFVTALENVDKSVVVLGLNACTRRLADLACAVVFCDAGALIANFPVAADLQGIPWAALPVASERILKNLKVRKLSCLGLKREALIDETLASAVLAARAESQVKIPFGDFNASVDALKPPAKVVKLVQQKKSVSVTPVSAKLPAKRFFSTLD